VGVEITPKQETSDHECIAVCVKKLGLLRYRNCHFSRLFALSC